MNTDLISREEAAKVAEACERKWLEDARNVARADNLAGGLAQSTYTMYAEIAGGIKNTIRALPTVEQSTTTPSTVAAPVNVGDKWRHIKIKAGNPRVVAIEFETAEKAAEFINLFTASTAALKEAAREIRDYAFSHDWNDRALDDIAAIIAKYVIGPSEDAEQTWCDHCSADLNGVKHILCERCYREYAGPKWTDPAFNANQQSVGERCVECGHSDFSLKEGKCVAAVPNTGEHRDTVKWKICAHRCVFPSTPEAQSAGERIARDCGLGVEENIQKLAIDINSAITKAQADTVAGMCDKIEMLSGKWEVTGDYGNREEYGHMIRAANLICEMLRAQSEKGK